MIKVIWQEAASPPHTDGSIVFTRLRQCAPPCNNASLVPPESASQTASRSVQPFFCGAHDCDRPTDRPRYSVGNNRPHLRSRLRCGLISLQKIPLTMPDCRPNCLTGMLGTLYVCVWVCVCRSQHKTTEQTAQVLQTSPQNPISNSVNKREYSAIKQRNHHNG